MNTASIIIVTYNSAAFIQSCLESIYAAISEKNTEVIIWDNASTDTTVKKIKKHFPQATIMASPTNDGFAAGVNGAAKQAANDILILLNPDTVVEKKWATALLSTFEEHRKVGAVNSKTKIVIEGKEYIQNAGNYVFYDGHSRDRGAVITEKREQRYETDSEYYQKETTVDAFSGVSVAIPRELFLSLGGFDEHFFMYYEDTDFSLRLQKAGYSIWYQPKSELKHIHSASSEEWSPFFVFQTELNRLLFLWKHFPLETVFAETAKYKASTFYQLLKLKKRFFTRLKVLFSIATHLPYLLSYRWKGTK